MHALKSSLTLRQFGAAGARAVLVLLAGGLWIAAVTADQADAPASIAPEQQQVLEWRQRRDEGLRRADGWLTLVGLEWLKPGLNKLGSGPGNDIQLPGGPDDWGTIELTDRTLLFIPAPGSGVTVDGATPDRVELVADDVGQPTVVRSGTLSFHVIFRESFGLRVSNSQAPTRLDFKGVENYDIQPDWRVEGRLVPARAGETVEISNVLGQVSATPVYGTLEFEKDGETYELIGLGDESSDSVWFIFADRTNGHGTYGAGRFLYSEGLPSAGRLVVDFNKAYNPPCAFNDYSTCPLPPQQNRLDLAVTAGEKEFHPAVDLN